MSISLIFGTSVSSNHEAVNPPTTRPTTSTTIAVVKTFSIKPDFIDRMAVDEITKKKIDAINAMNPELVTQLKSGKGGSIVFWEAVSWCETNHDWKNSGYYAGGLGIAQSAWRGYGGWEFAKSPKDATKEQQIIVANRLAFFGYQTTDVFKTLDDKLNNRPWFRSNVSATSWGRGCVSWKNRKPLSDMFTEAGMVEWRKTHSAAGVPLLKPQVKAAGLTGTVTTQSLRFTTEVKRCPEWETKLKAYGLPVDKFSYIMWRESRCQERVIGWNYKKGFSAGSCKKATADIYKHCFAVRSYDSGLLQINSSWKTLTAQVCGSKFGDLAPLLTADCNLKVAKALFDNGGMGHWKSTSGTV